ncbi:MAG: hypothetical protein KC619_01170 [Myxococcales bacterium]|nr:hypothetical protein [Myxococcales bacterium]
MRTFLPALLLLVPATASAQPDATVPADPATPLSDEARRIANDVPSEGTADPGEHYPISNEFSHHLWFDHVRDRGGAFVGVGTDQCYTIAAVQNASMLWLVDYDPLVPVIHRLYSALVPASDTPEQLVARFEDANEAATLALIRERLAGQPDVEEVARAYQRHHGRMHGYLRRVLRNPVGSWLSDPTLYARVRTLFESGRVVARNGDVTADGALRAVGRVAHRLGVPVRVIYFSNAEQFFPLGAGYRENVASLPTDDRTIVLRTFRERGVPYPPGERWHYLVQPLADQNARLEAGYRHSRQFVFDLLQRSGRYVGENGLSVLDERVPQRSAPAARRAARP